MFSLAFSAASMPNGDLYHPGLECYYNETADKLEPNWNHFLEPQSRVSSFCLVAWIRDINPLPVFCEIEICNLNDKKEVSPTSSPIQQFWNGYVLEKGLKVPRTSKHSIFGLNKT
jgi:hypothetical protein